MQASRQYGDVQARVDALRDAEWKAREPWLQRFRETPEEVSLRAAEGPISATTLEDCVASGCLDEYGEGLARRCREGLRLGRWMDTLPAEETADYRALRRMLP